MARIFMGAALFCAAPLVAGPTSLQIEQVGAAAFNSISALSGVSRSQKTCDSSAAGNLNITGGLGEVLDVADILVVGDSVYIGGCFEDWNGIAEADYIAKYSISGHTWSALVASGESVGVNGPVMSLALVGSNIVAGGKFQVEGDTNANGIGVWNPSTSTWDKSLSRYSCDGISYSPRFNALTEVRDLAVTGSDVYMVGRIDSVQGCRPLGGGTAPGGYLYYPGGFSLDGDSSLIATKAVKWDNATQTYDSLGDSIWNNASASGSMIPSSIALTASGVVYVGQHQTCCNQGTLSLSNKNKFLFKYESGAWSAITWNVAAPSGALVQSGPGRAGVFDLATSSNDLFVGGFFADAGGVAAADYVAKFDGTTWSSIGELSWDTPTTPGVLQLRFVGSTLYMSTSLPKSLWSWTSSSNSLLPVGTTQLGSQPRYLALAGTATSLFVGGSFSDAGGISAADYIASLTLSSNVALDSLGADSGTFAETWDPSDTTQSLSVPESSCSTTITYVAADSGASVERSIDGGVTYTPFGSGAINLVKGVASDLRIRVTSSDRTASRTYQVTVNRQGTATNPAATMSDATSLTMTSATLPGTVTANGHLFSFVINYGTVSGSLSSIATSGTVACTDAGSAVSGTMSGTAGTTYYYKIVLTRAADGQTFSSAEKSLTLESGPRIVLQSPSGITTSGATLNFTINPFSSYQNYKVEYGTSNSYGTCLPAAYAWETCGASSHGDSIPNGGTNNTQSLSKTLSGLSASTLYYYRVTTLSWGAPATRTETGTFTTASPVVDSVPPADTSPAPAPAPAPQSPPAQNTPPNVQQPVVSPETTASPVVTSPPQSVSSGTPSQNVGTTPSTKAGKSVSGSTLLKSVGGTVPSGAKVTVRVAASSAKFCKVSGTSVKALKIGSCRVTVTVTPKKGKATTKSVTLKVV